MKEEILIRNLLETRKKEYLTYKKLGIKGDVNYRLIKDILWILDDPEYGDW